MSQKFRITLDTAITLVQQFQPTLAAPAAQAPGQLSGQDALPLISASSSALKSQVTKLSLLTITSPFTHSAVTTVLTDINQSALPSLVTAALLVTPIEHTQAFQAEVLVLTKSALKEFASLLQEVQSVANQADGAADAPKKKQELTQSEKDVVTVAAGRVWEACDALIDFAAKGVIGFVARRVEEWRDLVRDAVEEIEEWDPDEEGDDFFDDLLSDDGQNPGGKNGDDDGDEDSDDEESSAALHENKKNSVRILKPVAQIYPAIITNRLKAAPELSPPLIGKLETLMLNLRCIPENVDEIAGALYEANFTKLNHYLGTMSEHAIKAVMTVASPWTESPDPAHESGDKFTTWSRTWLKVVGEVSKTIVNQEAKGAK